MHVFWAEVLKAKIALERAETLQELQIMKAVSVIKTNEFEYSRWDENNVWQAVGKGNAFGNVIEY